MITRRCSERRFFLRPDQETNNAFIYCLTVAAARTGVKIVFVHAASNHYHAGFRDPLGKYPEFLHYFHEFVAKSQNALRGRFENFWSSEQTSVVRLVESDDIIDKMLRALPPRTSGRASRRSRATRPFWRPTWTPTTD